MTNVTAESANKTDQKNQNWQASREDSGENTALDGRYGQIGISAVAAAVRYQGVTKNPAYAPAPINWRHSDEAIA